MRDTSPELAVLLICVRVSASYTFSFFQALIEHQKYVSTLTFTFIDLLLFFTDQIRAGADLSV